MGEAEGKKDEADYKRLQTFPLVRVSPGEGAGQPAGPAQPPRETGPLVLCRGGSSEGLHWLISRDLGVDSDSLIHSFIHSTSTYLGHWALWI